MATHGMDTRIYGRGYDLSPYFKSVEVSGSRAVADDSNFSDASRRYKGGRMSADLSADGLYSDGSGEIQTILETIFGTDTANDVYMVSPQGGTTVGDDFFGLKGILTKHKIGSPEEEMVDASIEVNSRNGLHIGRVLHEHAAETATSQSASVNHGAATSNGGMFFVVVTAFSATSITISAQESSDNGGGDAFADVSGSPLTFTGVGAQCVEIAEGTSVEQYLRDAVTAYSGGGSVTYISGFARYAT